MVRMPNVMAGSLTGWAARLGGPGLILLALIDNSVIPVPGSQDALTIILAARSGSWWPYYAVMSTIGAVIGGYMTYRLAEKGGEETLERKVGKKRAQKAYKKFEKGGFATVFIGALLPPPFPIVPVLMVPGIMQYPPKKFLGALAAGRLVRYSIDAYIGHRFGDAILGFFSQYYRPLLYGLLSLAVVGGLAALMYFKWYRPKRQQQERAAGEKVEEFPIPGKPNLAEQESQGGKSA